MKEDWQSEEYNRNTTVKKWWVGFEGLSCQTVPNTHSTENNLHKL